MGMGKGWEAPVSTQGREQRLVFGEVAELYDRHRPDYPGAVFDRMVEFGGLSAGDPVLEVGCGTGKATVPLAARGLLVTALEPSPQMARVAVRRTAAMGGVTVVVGSFEEWPLPWSPFRLLTSAQAWHWVDPEVRFTKACRALGARGCLALLWNTPSPADSSEELARAIEDVYRRVAPNLVVGVPGDGDDDRRPEIQASGLFVDVDREVYPWSTVYSAKEYLGLLRTQSNHRLLDPPVLERLLAEIAAVLAVHGDQVHQDYGAFLYLARRRD